MSQRDGKHYEICDFCSNEYQNGPHVYEFVVLKLYLGVFCCQGCHNGNYDGFAGHNVQRLKKLCEEKRRALIFPFLTSKVTCHEGAFTIALISA